MAQALLAQTIEMVKVLKVSNQTLQAEQAKQQTRQDEQMKLLAEMVKGKNSSSGSAMSQVEAPPSCGISWRRGVGRAPPGDAEGRKCAKTARVPAAGRARGLSPGS